MRRAHPLRSDDASGNRDIAVDEISRAAVSRTANTSPPPGAHPPNAVAHEVVRVTDEPGPPAAIVSMLPTAMLPLVDVIETLPPVLSVPVGVKDDVVERAYRTGVASGDLVERHITRERRQRNGKRRADACRCVQVAHDE